MSRSQPVDAVDGRHEVGDAAEVAARVVPGADFADALVDEIESPAHHREHIGVAY